jgi:hypothetical protein
MWFEDGGHDTAQQSTAQHITEKLCEDWWCAEYQGCLITYAKYLWREDGTSMTMIHLLTYVLLGHRQYLSSWILSMPGHVYRVNSINSVSSLAHTTLGAAWTKRRTRSNWSPLEFVSDRKEPHLLHAQYEQMMLFIATAGHRA